MILKAWDAPASIGVISDTHGLLRPEAVEALRGAGWLIHAGDVGKEQILGQLAAIAPVVAVRGNVDRGAWAERLPLTETLRVGDVILHVVHDVQDFHPDAGAAPIRMVISGHSHQPLIHEEGGVLYLNPGSAGPRRFKLPVSVARVEIDLAGRISTRLVELRV